MSASDLHPDRCAGCGYPAQDLPRLLCPECGEPYRQWSPWSPRVQALWVSVAVAIVSLELGLIVGSLKASTVPAFKSIGDYWARAWEQAISHAFIILPFAVAASVAAVYHLAKSGWKGSTRPVVAYAAAAGPPVVLFSICLAIVKARDCTIGMGTPPWLYSRIYDVGASPFTLLLALAAVLYLTRRWLARG